MARVYLLFSLLVSIAIILGGWYFINGFDFTDPSWWDDLGEYIWDYKVLPQYYGHVIFGAIGFQALSLFIFAITQNGAKSKTISGGRDSKDLHGSARFATAKEIKKSGLLADPNEGGVIVGGIQSGKLANVEPLVHNGPEHILGFAPTRSGKGVGLVIPTLLTWKESLLCLDIKGENFALTSGYRASLGHKILKFEPTNPKASVKYNPLAEIAMGTGNVVKDVQNIALMSIDPDGKGLNTYWLQAGYDWLTTVILHVIHKVKIEENRTANLKDVSLFFGAIDQSKESEEIENKLAQMAKEMAQYDHGDQAVNDAVIMGAGKMEQKAPQESSGVHSSASAALSLFADPVVSQNTAISDFQLQDLMMTDQPTDLYLIIPPSEMGRLRPLLRIIIAQILSRFTESMEYKNGKQVEHFKHKLLLMLDEFTSIGKMEDLERALAYMASYGMKTYLICQDNEQLTKAYGRENSIMSNCNIRIAYAPNKQETAALLERMLGVTTIIQRKTSVSRQEKGSSSSESLNEIKRPLLTADECSTLPKAKKNRKGEITRPGEMLTLISGEHPIKGKQFLFFQQPELLKRTRIPPPEIEIHTNQIRNIEIPETTDPTDQLPSYLDTKKQVASTEQTESHKGGSL